MEDEGVMPAPVAGKNVLIFSDGTGQVGGIYYDEPRTNVYKLFRATRVSPDTSIDPQKQVAFYDPGLGTIRPGGTALQRTYRRVYNLVSQATGLGITQNIIDCYAALIKLWRPGDRVFLFGFSRGAYTVRCLATVLWHCGIPTFDKDGTALKFDDASCQRIAAEAVKTVYQHVSSPRDKKYLQQRRLLGRLFRTKYKSHQEGDETLPNVFPFFIGVFDTVASLWSGGSLILVLILYLIGHVTVSLALALIFSSQPPLLSAFWYWSNWVFIWAFCGGLAGYVYTHLKFSTRLKSYWFWDVIHLTNFRQKFYDGFLHSKVKYARHAMSIDEKRGSFPRVIWGSSSTQYAPGAFDQKWFAGNHADIGGGYPETESRLSDVALQWMVDAATSPALGNDTLLIDKRHLEIKGDPLGILHDETRSSVFRFASKIDRSTKIAKLHESVLARLSADAAPQYDRMARYRPEALRYHPDVSQLYAEVPLPPTSCLESLKAIIQSARASAPKWLNDSMRNAMSSMNQNGKLDSTVSCLGFVGLLVTFALASWILLAWQVAPWLKDASWQSYPLSHFVALSTDWRGLQMIFDWILYLPTTVVLAVLGIGFFWLCGRISSRLYDYRSEDAQKR